mgnify:CR=1 FL=1
MALIKTRRPAFPSFMDWGMEDDLTDWMNLNFSPTRTTIPEVNVKESDNAFEIEMAVPGMKKDDFNIKLENNMLTISSEKKEEKKEGEGQYARREFSYQSFQRSFSLPENLVDSDKIDATYHDGILQLMLPKREHARPRAKRSIKIS